MSRNRKNSIGEVNSMAIVKTKKITVKKYLQLYPQTNSVVFILQKKYPMDKKTESEWQIVISNLLNTRL